MDANLNNVSTVSGQDVDMDLLLADLDIQDDDIMDIEAVADAEQTEVVEIKEEPAVEEMVEASEAEAAAETISMEAVEAEVEEPATTNEEPVVEPSEENDVSEELADAIGAEIEVEEERDAIYAEAPADATDLDTPAPAAPKKARASSGSGTGRVRQGLADLSEEAFVLTTDVPADLAANKAAVIASCPAQKKVKEKFENLLVSVASERLPSTYTQICFRALVAAPSSEITGVELTGALKASGLGEGTARSQSGQLMALFPALKIATRSGNKLTLNPDSTLVVALKAVMSL